MQRHFLRDHNRNLHVIFFFLMAAGIAYSVYAVVFSKGSAMRALMFYDHTDSFMDFYNVIFANRYFAEGGNSMYPAFANMIFYFFARLIPQNIIAEGGKAIRASQNGMFLYAVYLTVTSVAFALIVYNNKKGGVLTKTCAVFCMLLSAPFLFMIERGNVLYLAVIFSLLFIFGMDSDNKWIREVSFLCLAAAAAIKIYPALFGLLLLKEKRFKEAARCVAYGLALFVLPALLTCGVRYFINMYGRYAGISAVFNTSGMANNVSLTNLVKLAFAFFGSYSAFASKLGGFLTAALLFGGTGLSLCFKSRWKSVAMLCAVMVMVPGFSFLYTPLFFAIPLILFLDDPAQRTWRDYVYVLIFTAIFVPVALGGYRFFYHIVSIKPVNLSVVLRGAALIAMTLMLFADGIRDAAARWSMRRTLKKAPPASPGFRGADTE